MTFLMFAKHSKRASARRFDIWLALSLRKAELAAIPANGGGRRSPPQLKLPQNPGCRCLPTLPAAKVPDNRVVGPSYPPHGTPWRGKGYELSVGSGRSSDAPCRIVLAECCRGQVSLLASHWVRGPALGEERRGREARHLRRTLTGEVRIAKSASDKTPRKSCVNSKL